MLPIQISTTYAIVCWNPLGLIVTGLVFRYIWPGAHRPGCDPRCDRPLRQLRSYSTFRALMFPSKKKNGSGCSDRRNRKELWPSAALRRANRVRVRRLASGRSNFVRQFENHAFTYRECVCCGQFTRKRRALASWQQLRPLRKFAERDLRDAIAKRVEWRAASDGARGMLALIYQLPSLDGPKRYKRCR